MAELKQISVTFEFDPETETVSKLNCFVDGIEKKKVTTRKAPTKKIVLESEAIITLEANKLVFNNKAVADMGLEYQNRIIIIYEKFANTNRLVPTIGTDMAFDQEGSGNKVTKTNTVSYRGKANTILAEYGNEFTIENYKEGIWKLISKQDNTNLDNYESIVDAIPEDADVIFTDEDKETEIQPMDFKL